VQHSNIFLVKMNISELKRLIAAEQLRQQETEAEHAGFEKFSAAQLYCPKCKQAMPVKEKPLLHLAGGQLYDYLCVQCGESLGTRRD
jgi:hypothetical protein